MHTCNGFDPTPVKNCLWCQIENGTLCGEYVSGHADEPCTQLSDHDTPHNWDWEDFG